MESMPHRDQQFTKEQLELLQSDTLYMESVRRVGPEHIALYAQLWLEREKVRQAMEETGDPEYIELNSILTNGLLELETGEDEQPYTG